MKTLKKKFSLPGMRKREYKNTSYYGKGPDVKLMMSSVRKMGAIKTFFQ